GASATGERFLRSLTLPARHLTTGFRQSNTPNFRLVLTVPASFVIVPPRSRCTYPLGEKEAQPMLVKYWQAALLAAMLALAGNAVWAQNACPPDCCKSDKCGTSTITIERHFDVVCPTSACKSQNKCCDAKDCCKDGACCKKKDCSCCKGKEDCKNCPCCKDKECCKNCKCCKDKDCCKNCECCNGKNCASCKSRESCNDSC